MHRLGSLFARADLIENTLRYYEIYSIPMPIIVAAMTVREMCNYWNRFLGPNRILIENVSF
jgi:hypothetical protein